MEYVAVFLLGVATTIFFSRRGLLKLSSVTITTRLVSREAPILLSCVVKSVGAHVEREEEYAEDLDLGELYEQLLELDIAREDLQDYIDDYFDDDDDEFL